MKYKAISYRRAKNLGNYENEVLEMSIELDEHESPEAAFIRLKRKVKMLLGLVLDAEEETLGDLF